MNSAIRYLQHDDIDPAKWDACVHNARNGLIYGYSWYLDHFAKDWDGLVLGDYEAVMALPWNKKYGIRYLYQPPFTVCSGIYGNDLSEKSVTDFIQAIPAKFRLIEINLNAGNIFGTPHSSLQAQKNYILSLQPPYETLYNNYRDHVKRNIRRCVAAGCSVRRNIPVSAVAALAKDQLQSVVKIKDDDLKQFEKLYELLSGQGKAVTYGVYSDRDELLASSVFFFSHNRAYYILVGNHPNGKTLGASHYLIDRFIADHAERDLILDFEGSDIPSLAFYYSSFGAEMELYPVVRIDKLPWYVRMLR